MQYTTKRGEEYEIKDKQEIKAHNERLAHKRILKKSTRIDEENQQQCYWNLCKNCA